MDQGSKRSYFPKMTLSQEIGDFSKAIPSRANPEKVGSLQRVQAAMTTRCNLSLLADVPGVIQQKRLLYLFFGVYPKSYLVDPENRHGYYFVRLFKSHRMICLITSKSQLDIWPQVKVKVNF